MKTKMSIYKALLLIAVIVGLGSCSGMLDDIKPRDSIPQSNLTSEDIAKVVNGVYSKIQSDYFSFWWTEDIQGENVKGGPGWSPILDPQNMTPDGSGAANCKTVWYNSFSDINQINFLIELYESASNKDNFTVKQMGMVGYYFRALIYYRLAVHYGNVPIMKERTYDVVPISKETKVWSFIESDLKKAMELSTTQSSQWYVSADAINALMARVELFQKKNTEAAGYAGKVLANSSYALSGTSMEFSSIFLPKSTSKEIVFAFSNQTSNPGFSFADYCNDRDASWAYSPTDENYKDLYADDNSTHRAGDIRKAATFSPTDATRIIKYPNGVQQLVATTDYTHIPIMVTRISEMYLIKAEALGKMNGAETLHQFLAKRYTTAPTTEQLQALSDEQYESLILDERHREFFAEGFRWSDVKRTGQYDQLKQLQSRTYLMYWPIPSQEIQMAGSDKYPQNPGYDGAK